MSTGTVTKAALRLSAAPDAAFVDFGVANLLTSRIGGKLTLMDSAGKTLTGYIKAAGTGETYGSELLANTALEDTTSLTPWQATLAAVGGGQSGNCLQVTISTGDQGNASQAVSPVDRALHRFSAYFKLGTADRGFLGVQRAGGAYDLHSQLDNLTNTAWQEFVQYACVDAQSYGTQVVLHLELSHQGETGFFDTLSFKRVLTPSTTGVTIVSAPGGTDYNWNAESGFNYADDGGYTYSIVLYFGACDISGVARGTATNNDAAYVFWSAYTCPGTGPKTIVALESIGYGASLACGLRLAVYDITGTDLIHETAMFTQPTSPEAWRGETGLNVPGLTGGEDYLLAWCSEGYSAGVGSTHIDEPHYGSYRNGGTSYAVNGFPADLTISNKHGDYWMHPVRVGVVDTPQAEDTIHQVAFRWRNDDGPEVAPV